MTRAAQLVEQLGDDVEEIVAVDRGKHRRGAENRERLFNIGHWVVMADPEGNECCVCNAGQDS